MTDDGAASEHAVTVERAVSRSRGGRPKPTYRWVCSCGAFSSWQVLQWFVAERGAEHEARASRP